MIIKYTDIEGVERLAPAKDVRAKMNKGFAEVISFIDDDGRDNHIDHPTTAYVMNSAGATVAKYVILGLLPRHADEQSDPDEQPYLKPFARVAGRLPA